jgi:hypothetical protein
MRRRLLGVLLLFALSPAHALHAQRSLEISSLDATYDVSRDGTLSVTERITAHFSGQWNGLYRVIPLRYSMPLGTSYIADVHIRDVRDETGRALRHEESREGAFLKVKAWIPGANDATHSLVLTYDVDHALRFFNDDDDLNGGGHDELYWNVTGNSWDYPIESVHARVQFPAGATGLRTAVYTGLTGATSSDAISSTNAASSTADFQTARPLQLHEGMTIVVGWAPGLIARPTRLDRLGHWLRGNLIFMLPIFLFLIMFMIWLKWGKDPAIGTVVTQYEPPAGMTPAEVGTVVDMSVDDRDIAATLVDLAVRGHIRIHETESAKILGLTLGTGSYSIERLLPPAEYAKLAEHERLMMTGLFESGRDKVTMSELHNSFYTTLSQIKTRLWKCMMDAGLFRQDPNTVRGIYVFVAIVVYALVHVVGVRLAVQYGVEPEMVMFVGILCAVIVFAFGTLMPRGTMRGVQIVRKVLGFQEFLSRVEGDRMRTVIDRPELFEKYLPHAIALGVDRQWAKKFEGLTLPAPQWYVGPYVGPFHPHLFVGQVSHMTSAVGSTLSSSPRGSSGSGFSGGGGSSGGGFGGGGGGGF